MFDGFPSKQSRRKIWLLITLTNGYDKLEWTFAIFFGSLGNINIRELSWLSYLESLISTKCVVVTVEILLDDRCLQDCLHLLWCLNAFFWLRVCTCSSESLSSLLGSQKVHNTFGCYVYAPVNQSILVHL